MTIEWVYAFIISLFSPVSFHFRPLSLFLFYFILFYFVVFFPPLHHYRVNSGSSSGGSSNSHCRSGSSSSSSTGAGVGGGNTFYPPLTEAEITFNVLPPSVRVPGAGLGVCGQGGYAKVSLVQYGQNPHGASQKCRSQLIQVGADAPTGAGVATGGVSAVTR